MQNNVFVDAVLLGGCVARNENKTKQCCLFLTVLLDYWPTETPVKRKRGRPKGSTKKIRTDLTEGTAISSHSPENNSREEKRKKEEIQQFSSAEGGIVALYSVNQSFVTW